MGSWECLKRRWCFKITVMDQNLLSQSAKHRVTSVLTNKRNWRWLQRYKQSGNWYHQCRIKTQTKASYSVFFALALQTESGASGTQATLDKSGLTVHYVEYTMRNIIHYALPSKAKVTVHTFDVTTQYFFWDMPSCIVSCLPESNWD